MADFMCSKVIVIGALSDVGSSWQNLDSRGRNKTCKSGLCKYLAILSITGCVSLPNKISVFWRLLHIFRVYRYRVEVPEFHT